MNKTEEISFLDLQKQRTNEYCQVTEKQTKNGLA